MTWALRYPAGDYDRPFTLAATLGSFWAQTYAGRDQVRAHAAGFGRGMDQAHADLLEAQRCLAFATVPPLHVEEVRRLPLYRSQGPLAAQPPPFGGPGTAAHGGGDAYGVAPPGEYPFPLPREYRRVPLIVNRLRDPSRTLVDGLDYRVEPGRIVFRADPFAAGPWATRPVFDGGGLQVDTEITLWLLRPGLDRGFVADHLAYLLGVDVAPEPAARDALAAVLGAYAGGTARDDVEAILQAITGIRLAGSDGETVVAVGGDDGGLHVVTDRDAYRFPAAARPAVAPGDVVAAGQPLCDALRLDELNRGEVPAGVTALALSRGLLAGRFLGDLVFEDREVPLVRGRDGLGRPRLSFPVAGFPADVDHFFDLVAARERAQGRSLDQLLGTPPPAVINPLRFLVGELLRGGAFLVRIRAGAVGPRGAGLDLLRLLRRVIPPQTVALFLIEMAPVADSITMEPAGEVLGAYSAPGPLAEGVVPLAAWDGPGRPWILSRTCQ